MEDLKKITFGTKTWTLFTDNKGVAEVILRALNVRGYSNITVEIIPGESMWDGHEQMVAVSGTFGRSGRTYLMYLTPDSGVDEKVREALSFTEPTADMTSVLMNKPE